METRTVRSHRHGWTMLPLTMLPLTLLTAACGTSSPDDPAANEAVTIENPENDTAMTGSDDIALYSTEELRRYLDGDETVGRRFEMDRVTFASGSASIDAAARAQIGDVAAVLKDFPTATVTVSAFADPEGTVEANRKLTADRALAVEQALEAAGIPDIAVTTMIGGEIGTSVSREKRRVEFMVERR